jgi:hypothetical protein
MSAQSTESISSPESFDGKSQLFDQLASLMAMQEQLQKQVEDYFREVRNRLDSIEDRIIDAKQDTTETNASPNTEWEAKKQAIYEEHGMVADDAARTQPEPTSRPKETAGNHSHGSGEDIQAEVDFDSMKATDADHTEIEQLKQQLHEKLRLAEMELSISRAKIIQETAQLADQRHELEKMAAQMTPPTPSSKDGKKPSMLDRLSRHMIPVRKSNLG